MTSNQQNHIPAQSSDLATGACSALQHACIIYSTNTRRSIERDQKGSPIVYAMYLLHPIVFVTKHSMRKFCYSTFMHFNGFTLT